MGDTTKASSAINTSEKKNGTERPALDCLESLHTLQTSVDELISLLVLHRGKFWEDSREEEGLPASDLEDHARTLKRDLTWYDELLLPLCTPSKDTGTLLHLHIRQLFALAFANVDVAVCDVRSRLERDVRGEGGFNWAYPSLLYGVILQSAWDHLCNEMLGMRQPKQSEREEGKIWSLEPKAQAAIMNIPAGSIAVLAAKVTDPRSTGSSVKRLFVKPQYKCTAGSPAPLCQAQLPAELKTKLGYKCKRCR